MLLVLIVELLNSGIEAAIDRVSFELHDLSKRAKDLASAAVFLSLLLCAGIWAAALWHASSLEIARCSRFRSASIAARAAATDARFATPRERVRARCIGQRGWQLVYGGGRAGLMGAVADAALAAGAHGRRRDPATR